MSVALYWPWLNWDKDENAAQLIKVFSLLYPSIFAEILWYIFILKYSQESRINRLLILRKLIFPGAKSLSHIIDGPLPLSSGSVKFLSHPNGHLFNPEHRDGFPPSISNVLFGCLWIIYWVQMFSGSSYFNEETGLDRTFKHLFNKW